MAEYYTWVTGDRLQVIFESWLMTFFFSLIFFGLSCTNYTLLAFEFFLHDLPYCPTICKTILYILWLHIWALVALICKSGLSHWNLQNKTILKLGVNMKLVRELPWASLYKWSIYIRKGWVLTVCPSSPFNLWGPGANTDNWGDATNIFI